MSRFLFDNNSLFLHIPKTGGTWVNSVLIEGKIPNRKCAGDHPGWNHCLINHYPKKWLQRFDFFFSFVRHPIPYYESTWKLCQIEWLNLGKKLRHRIKHHPLRRPHQIYTEQSRKSFDHWVESILELHPCWYTRLIESFVGPDNQEFCQFIGRTETLREDLLIVLRHLGCKVDEDFVRNYPKQNVVPKKISWNPDLKAQVLFEERDMIRRFYGKKTIDRRWFRMEQKEP